MIKQSYFTKERTPPWVALGHQVGHKTNTGKEAMRIGGLDWTVDLQPIFYQVGGSQKKCVVPDKKAVVRSSDGECLGIVGNRFYPVQNEEAFKIMDEILPIVTAKYDTVGSLDNGKKVWILARVPVDMVITDDDIHQKYILLSNSHDGTGLLKLMFTSIRVICNNMLNIAIRNTQNLFSIRHTTFIQDAIEEAREAIKTTDHFYREMETWMRNLLEIKFSSEEMYEISKSIFGLSKNSSISTRRLNQVNKLVELFHTGMGNDLPNIKGTAYAALSAAVEYDTWYAPKNGEEEFHMEKRLDDIWFDNKNTVQYRMAEKLSSLIAA